MKYLWGDNNTHLEIEVYRKLEDCDTPPDKDEAIAAGMDINDYAEAIWVRIVGPAAVHRTDNWGSKGNL